MEKSSVYTSFERKINGENRKFWIQILPPDEQEEVIDYFCKYYIRDEPTSKCLKIIEDEDSINYLSKLWRSIIKKESVLACFTELSNGEKDLAAVNMCYRTSIGDRILNDKEEVPELAKRFIDTLDYVNRMKDISKELGVTEYLGTLGLLTIPKYRGINIGLELLKARKLLCDKLGLKATVTQFTAPTSQRLAEKAGFKDLVSITYDDLEKLRPSSKFENINEYCKCVRNMYILYD